MAKKKMRLLKSKGFKTPKTRGFRLPLRDKKGRFMKRVKRAKRVHAPALTVRRGVPARGGREFIQRYFIDKFRKGKRTEWEVWTIASKGTPPLMSKRQVLKKVESIV